MGWGRTLLLGDIGNRLDIADTERDIKRLKRRLSKTARKDMSQDQQIAQLVAENTEIKLYLASLIRLMTAKGSISADELDAMVATVDAEDGAVDGSYDGKIA
jgi:hypothetical protein